MELGADAVTVECQICGEIGTLGEWSDHRFIDAVLAHAENGSPIADAIVREFARRCNAAK